jgi:hypothetical protein
MGMVVVVHSLQKQNRQEDQKKSEGRNGWGQNIKYLLLLFIFLN